MVHLVALAVPVETALWELVDTQEDRLVPVAQVAQAVRCMSAD
jgi:hypothetical protein